MFELSTTIRAEVGRAGADNGVSMLICGLSETGTTGAEVEVDSSGT